jgi:hypothetical protein
MNEASLLRRAASLVQRADLPLPGGMVPSGTAPVVAVGVQPHHPANAVLVEMRREGGPGEYLRVLREVVAAGAQWFRAVLPPLEEGRSVDYRVELVRAGELLAALPADGSWLTVTGQPRPPPTTTQPRPTESAMVLPSEGVPRWAYNLDFFAALTINLRPENLGETPDGYRINFLVESGRVVGPRIDAIVRPDGGDWMCIRRDGIGVLDVRTTYETSDGALILDRAGGVFDLGPDGYAKVAAGQLRGAPEFYATPTLMTAHPRWLWLNRLQGFGIGRVVLEKLQVQCDIYIPKVLGRLDDA